MSKEEVAYCTRLEH